MKLTIFHLKNCDTCKKAIKKLEATGHDLTLVDVRTDGVPPAMLERIMDAVGIEAALNTRSTTWRNLDDSAKENITREKALQLMTDHPTLIKRPVIDDGTTVTVGWTKTVQERFLGQD